VLIFDRHGSPPSIEAENPDDPKTVNVGRRDPGLETNGRRTEARRRSTVKPLNIKRQLSLSKQRAEVRTVGKKAFMPANELSKISNGEPIQAAAELVSEPSFPSAAALRSQIQWRFQALLGTEGGQPGAFVVNRGNDDMLKKKLLAEFEGRSIFLAPNMHSSAVVPMRQEFTISWSVVRAESFATVEAVVTLGGQSKTLTFKSAGSCAEHACENAVRDAVSGVLAVMEGQLSADGKGELATGF
jgi:hypothetical protein